MNKPTVFGLLVISLVVSLFFNGYLLSKGSQGPKLKPVKKANIVNNSPQTTPSIKPIELPASPGAVSQPSDTSEVEKQISTLVSLNYIDSDFESEDADASGVLGTLTIRIHGLSRHAVLKKENVRFSQPVKLDALVVSENELSLYGRFSKSGALEITLPEGIELLNGSKTTSAYSFADMGR